MGFQVPLTDVVLPAIVLVIAWRNLSKVLEKAKWCPYVPYRIRLPFQYYTILYVVLGCVAVNGILKSIKFLGEHSLLRESMPILEDPNLQAEVPPMWLLCLSLGTPVAMTGSFVIGGSHVFGHVREMHKFGRGHISTAQQRDRTIMVVTMPVVYSIMAFHAVLHLWDAFRRLDPELHEVDAETWKRSEEHANFEYAMLYAVAQLYESMSMGEFVQLSLEAIQSHIRSSIKAINIKGEGVTQSFVQYHMLMLKVLNSLTLQGVNLFVFTCLLDAIYNFVVVHYVRLTGHVPTWEATSTQYIGGMGFLSSSAAIMNVISVETTLHAQMGFFRVAPKFLSVKIMVSIAYIQGLVIGVLSHQMSGLHGKLLYSSLMCYEILGLSIFHWYAWPTEEAWLRETEELRVHARQRWLAAERYGIRMKRWAARARYRLANGKSLKDKPRPALEAPLLACLWAKNA